MKTHRHNSVSSVKGLFDAIPMMAVNINIKHSLVSLKHLYYSQHAVVNVAETRSLKLFCVMEATRPINRNFTLVRLQLVAAEYATSGVALAVVQHVVKDGTVIIGKSKPVDLV